ncbi:hypothetical protein DSO57_1017867 [Entomophthora muscae]|uniref:Uncharacterized protein n=1 Tax=Entomophthora muscae TaxID=34485 RepID=A0ACC2TGD7_9FUNG|nr:hypothetical protein DSO57_1017867 [Entomophthora muscae]
MTSPVTLQPNHPQETKIANESTSTQLFSVLYITLTGLVDSIVPTNGPWDFLKKVFSYKVNLAPTLWWAFPSDPVGCLPASSPESATGKLPEIYGGSKPCGRKA